MFLNKRLGIAVAITAAVGALSTPLCAMREGMDMDPTARAQLVGRKPTLRHYLQSDTPRLAQGHQDERGEFDLETPYFYSPGQVSPPSSGTPEEQEAARRRIDELIEDLKRIRQELAEERARKGSEKK